MRIVNTAFLGAIVMACGSSADQPAEEQPLASVSDSLIPIADAMELPEDRPEAPAETVYVETPAPPPSSPTRVATNRPTPPPPPAISPTPAPASPPPAAAATAGLASGATMSTVSIDSIHSRYNAVGDQVRVRVSGDVLASDGRVVIPSGSIVTLTIVEIEPAANKGEAGKLALSARSVMIEGNSYPITARVTDYAYEMKGRGIGTEEAAKTGAGAVAGGIIGRVIGGKTGTVVGAVGGAAAGAAIADKQADRDVVVATGSSITIALRDDFNRP